MKTIVFTAVDIQTIVRCLGVDRLMDELIEALTAACREQADGQFSIPARGGFEYHTPDLGLIEWMPVLQHGRQATVKIVGYHPSNPEKRRLPTILSTAMTFDTTSGHLTALIDGTFPTALRTGAASAIASRALTPPGARVLGLIGCGAQAVTQLHALSRIFHFEEVLVHDIHSEALDSFCRRIGPLALHDLRVRAVTPDVIAAQADIICTATSVALGAGPVFEDRAMKPSVHVNAVGSDFRGKTELPLSLLKRSLVCPDFRSQALMEGECQQLEAQEIGPDLDELVRNGERYAAMRDGPTVFDSTGWALEDHVVVDLLCRHGTKLGCGTWMEIELDVEDPRSPYEFLDEVQLVPGRVLRK